jgi:hypothetical protein
VNAIKAPDGRDTCYVLMPLSQTSPDHTGDFWTKHFDDFLKPLIEENPKLEARRSTALRAEILREIITALVVSKVVVADLTDRNPNVYWELGVRQSFKHGTVTIAETGTQLPFDISGKGVLFYDSTDYRNATFRRSFKEALQDCLDHPERPDSHVLETISGRGTLFGAFRLDEALRRLDALLSEAEHNSGTWKKLHERATTFQGEPSKRKSTYLRFRVAAIELLVTNRYLDEPPVFYKAAEDYSGILILINRRLDNWDAKPNTTEKFVLRFNDSFVKASEAFKDQLSRVRKELVTAHRIV